MGVNSQEISNVYSSVFSSVIAKYNELWDDNKIDAETYAQLVGQASSQLITVSAELVQKQEQLDDGFATSAKQRELIDKDIELKTAQIIGSGYDNQVKAQQVLESTYKVEELLPAELLQLQKQVDVAERGMVEQELTGTKQRLAIDKDNLLKDDELVINTKKKSQMDAQTSEMLDGTLRANTQLDDVLLTNEKQRDILTTEKLIKAYENEVLQLDAHEVNSVELEIKDFQLREILPKEAIMLTEQKETADAQQLALAKDLEIKDIQKQVSYVERVIKDKEAATLGMDNAIKIAQTSKATNSAYIYTPQYEEI